MKRIISVLTIVATLAIGTVTARAATWNNVFGIGNPGGQDLTIGGAGALLSVVPSVRSNTIYHVTSASGQGAPFIDRVWLQNDFVSGNVDFLVGTNSWVCASNQPAGTNIIWLTATNNAMATNDVLVLQTVGSDSYQILLVSGNATDAFGTVYSNALGQVGFKVWNTPTNTISRGDIIWKMALQQRFTPLSMGSVTNQILPIPAVHFGDWVVLGPKENPIKFTGRSGVPSAIMMSYSNAADMQIVGQFLPTRIPTR